MTENTTRLRFPSGEVVVTTDGTQAAHTRAVTAAVRSGYARRIAELERIRDAAKDAYTAADAAVPGYGPEVDKTERAALAEKRRKARNAWADAERVLTGPERRPQDGAYSRLKPTVVPMGETPEQARRAVRRGPVAPRPVTLPFAPGSWVGWTEPDGVQRRGVVVSDRLSGTPWMKNGRWVLPDDGGDQVCIGPGFARTVATAVKTGRWELYGPKPGHPYDTYTGVFAAPIPCPEG